MFLNLKSALVALVLLVAIFAAGCGGGGGDLAASITPATVQSATPGNGNPPPPPPFPEPGVLRLTLDQSTLLPTEQRIVWALTVGDRIEYGPVEAELTSELNWAWDRVPFGGHTFRVWLMSDSGYVSASSTKTVQIQSNQETLVGQLIWLRDPGRAISFPVRPVTWNHQGRQPQYDSLAETKMDLGSMDPLIAAGRGQGHVSIYLIDRATSTFHYVWPGRWGWKITKPDYLGQGTAAMTTVTPWTSDWQYFSRTGRRGIARFGVPFERHSNTFDGVEILALDGAADRIFALYRAIGTGEYRVRVTTTNPYEVESDFGLELPAWVTPTCLESEPSTERIWVGTREGGLYCFRRNGDWPYQIAYASDDQGLGITSLAMVDDRFLAVAFPGFGEVRFVDTRLELLMTSVVIAPGVTQIASVENDTYLAAITRYATGESYLQWHKRVSLP